ncbi:MAG TPA: DUF4240 domain-containing protein, partial [Verrucomicrobiae bacterium]|nr:DUF4240 domain-containing protein [Verrucomicrobiae bacterium]
MNVNDFWRLVERVHEASPKDMTAKCQALAGELRLLVPPEIESFAEHLGEHYYQAYTQDIWGAAFVIK